MPADENCKHGNSSPASILKALPGSQAGTGRHKCTVCAYQRGFEASQLGLASAGRMEACNHKSRAPLAVLKRLPDSQAGAGRHKCAICAYQRGMEAGIVETGYLAKIITRKSPPAEQTTISQAGKLEIESPPKYRKSEAEKSPTFKSRKISEHSYGEHRNMQLGKAGELLVLEYEKASLKAQGRADLAEQVVHVAMIEGDGAGYDIRSFSPEGKTRYIEVKTTRGNADTPFFITSNELEFSKRHEKQYHLYRVFHFDAGSNSGKTYIVQGNVESSFNLEPTVYRVSRS